MFHAVLDALSGDGAILIGVDAVHFGDSDRIATAVLKQIADRVNAG